VRGLPKADARQLVETTHRVCPHSNNGRRGQEDLRDWTATPFSPGKHLALTTPNSVFPNVASSLIDRLPDVARGWFTPSDLRSAFRRTATIWRQT